MSKQKTINIAIQVVDTAIKNSDIVAPYVPPKQYAKGLVVLNAAYFLLKMLGRKQDNQNPAE